MTKTPDNKPAESSWRGLVVTVALLVPVTLLMVTFAALLAP